MKSSIKETGLEAYGKRFSFKVSGIYIPQFILVSNTIYISSRDHFILIYHNSIKIQQMIKVDLICPRKQVSWKCLNCHVINHAQTVGSEQDNMKLIQFDTPFVELPQDLT